MMRVVTISVFLLVFLLSGPTAVADDPPVDAEAQRRQAYEQAAALEERLNVLVEGVAIKTAREMELEAQVERLEQQVADLQAKLSKCPPSVEGE